MQTAFRRILMFATAALMIGGTITVYADQGQRGGPGQDNNNGQSTQLRLRTTLAGAAIQGKKPEGNADFRNDGQSRVRLSVEVENVNLTAGTVLTVSVVHAGLATVAGTIVLRSGVENELELETQRGAVVPAIVSGDMVTVSNGSAVILAGAF
jgi:hypothetical protein